MPPASRPALSWSVPSVGETVSASCCSKVSGSAPYLSTFASSVADSWVNWPVTSVEPLMVPWISGAEMTRPSSAKATRFAGSFGVTVTLCLAVYSAQVAWPSPLKSSETRHCALFVVRRDHRGAGDLGALDDRLVQQVLLGAVLVAGGDHLVGPVGWRRRPAAPSSSARPAAWPPPDWHRGTAPGRPARPSADGVAAGLLGAGAAAAGRPAQPAGERAGGRRSPSAWPGSRSAARCRTRSRTAWGWRCRSRSAWPGTARPSPAGTAAARSGRAAWPGRRPAPAPR